MKSHTLSFVAAVWLLSTSHAWGSSRQTSPTDDVAQPCVNAYYGVGEPVDYVKAYKCFESLRVYQFMILMQLNGQGVHASAAKAQEIMDEWRKANPDSTDEEFFDDDKRIAVVLKEKTIEVPISPKLDYCDDVASHGFEWRYCSSLDNTLSEQSTNQELGKIRAKLSPKDAVIWDALTKAFADYVQAEGNRGDDKYAGGTMAPQGYDEQQIYVRKSFLGFAQRTFVYMKLEPTSKDELANSEGILKRTSDEVIADYEKSYSDDETDDEIDPNDARYIAQFKTDSEASQKAWLVLRSQCEELAKRIYSEKAGVDWGVSAKNALTLVRATDVKQATAD